MRLIFFPQTKAKVRYILSKIGLHQALLDAYNGNGWKNANTGRLKPQSELQSAQSSILKCKVGLVPTSVWIICRSQSKKCCENILKVFVLFVECLWMRFAPQNTQSSLSLFMCTAGGNWCRGHILQRVFELTLGWQQRHCTLRQTGTVSLAWIFFIRKNKCSLKRIVVEDFTKTVWNRASNWISLKKTGSAQVGDSIPSFDRNRLPTPKLLFFGTFFLWGGGVQGKKNPCRWPIVKKQFVRGCWSVWTLWTAISIKTGSITKKCSQKSKL